MKLLTLAFCYIICHVSTMELPYYVPRCSLSDPKFQECVVRSANIVIPKLINGDGAYGISAISPKYISKGFFKGHNVSVNFTDIYVYHLDQLRLTSASFQNNKLAFSADLNSNVMAKYVIQNGKLLDRSISGNGTYNTIVVCKINYYVDIATDFRDGETYVQPIRSNTKLIPRRTHFFFENLKFPDGTDANEFVDDNWKVLQEDLAQDMEFIVTMFIESVLYPILKIVPLQSIFLE